MFLTAFVMAMCLILALAAVPVRGVGLDEQWQQGFPLTTVEHYTLAAYTAAQTTAPAVGDAVTFSSTAHASGRALICRQADNAANVPVGRIKSVNTTDLTVVVEWLNVLGFASFPCSVLASATLLNSIIKAGDTTVANDYDATTTVGCCVCIGKSAATGAGTIVGAWILADA